MSVGTVSESRKTKFWWRIIREISIVGVALFAVFGMIAASFEAWSWYSGASQTFKDLNVLLAADSSAKALAFKAWEDFKFLLQFGTLLLGAIGLLAAMTQVKTIARLISDFIVARGPIYSLGTTITEVEKSVETLSREVDRLSKLEPTIREMSEKIEETFAQIANLQRFAVSERSGTTEEEPAVQSAGRTQSAPPQPQEDKNWERLRELWNANGERLDEVIGNISDKRRRARFQKMPKTNYPAIINALADEKHINEAARNASLELHRIFMSFKPRNRKIPDDAVESVVVLDLMLAKEIQLSKPSDEEPPTSAPAAPPVDIRASASA